MELSQTCARCGGSNLETGKLKPERGKVSLRLFNAPFISILSTDIDIEAAICLDCGNIQFSGDAARAREVLKK